MKYRVITQARAEADIVDIFHWIAKDSPVHAARWVEELESAIVSLQDLPHRCRLAPESAVFEREIRQLLHGNYRILFTISEEEVHVLHVRHGARQYMKPEDAS